MFWKKKKQTFDETIEKARKDPQSLGSLLLKFGRIDNRQLEKALSYQREHENELLGKTLIELEFIDRETLETFLLIQDGKKVDIEKVLKLIKYQEKKLTLAHQAVRLASSNIVTIV